MSRDDLDPLMQKMGNFTKCPLAEPDELAEALLEEIVKHQKSLPVSTQAVMMAVALVLKRTAVAEKIADAQAAQVVLKLRGK